MAIEAQGNQCHPLVHDHPVYGKRCILSAPRVDTSSILLIWANVGADVARDRPQVRDYSQRGAGRSSKREIGSSSAAFEPGGYPKAVGGRNEYHGAERG